MPHIDDTVPFRKRVKDIADKIEARRQEFNENRKRSGIGTFSGLEAAIAKRKKESQDAKRNRY
jgi:hypothetical protein